jgi:hypothetical protein
MSSHESVSVAPSPVGRLAYRGLAIRGGPFVLAGVAVAAVVVTHLVNFGADDLRIRLFDANSDSSWSHLMVAGTLVAATGVGLIGAWRSQRQRSLWSAVAGILGFLSIDEISSLHAQIDQMSWGKVLYAPILLALCVCVWRLSDGGERSVVVRAGLATLLVSFGIHVFGPHVVHALGWGTDSWAYQAKVALKQGTELAGWLLVLWGLWRLVLSRPPVA